MVWKLNSNKSYLLLSTENGSCGNINMVQVCKASPEKRLVATIECNLDFKEYVNN